MGAKDYPEELVRHLLCKSPRLKIIDRNVLGNRINEIKSKNGLDLLEQNENEVDSLKNFK